MSIAPEAPAAYPVESFRLVRVDDDALGILGIHFDSDLQGVLDGAVNALLCYGVRGDYESLGEAVQALGRRAEAAEAAPDEDADPDEILLDVVRAVQGELSVTPEEFAILAVRVRQMLLRRYRLVRLVD